MTLFLISLRGHAHHPYTGRTKKRQADRRQYSQERDRYIAKRYLQQTRERENQATELP